LRLAAQFGRDEKPAPRKRPGFGYYFFADLRRGRALFGLPFISQIAPSSNALRDMNNKLFSESDSAK
jgi:hypothetical protein